jgi:N-acetylmuramoyl-L-alanine amidase-like protein/flagellar hook capping protein FlgD
MWAHWPNRMRMLRVAAVLFFLAPAGAWAASGGPAIVSQDLPVGVSRTTAGAAAPKRFDLVGLHWQGSGSVLFRTRSVAGRWTRWQRAAPEDEDQPDVGTAEDGTRRGWRLGDPYWVGRSNRLEWRLRGKVTRLRAWYVSSPTERSAVRLVSMAGSPKILTRAAWHADDEILRGSPRYSGHVYFAVVHHTAGSNAYTAAQSPAILRAIQLYHVKGNGWNDIGYNFLVDKYGQVFEGRIGGIARNVVGAHAEGFNYGSTGVAVIGNYGSASITPAAQRALVKLLAWRLDVAHVDPLSIVDWSSGGNPKYPLGTHLKLRAISGHRDTGFTSCPGTRLYARLPDIARQAAATGLPKLYAPTAVGALGGPVKFAARLSTPAAWTVTVKSFTGAVVATGRGTGSTVAWTWNSAGATPGSYTWTVEAGPDTRPATGTVGQTAVTPPPAPALLTGLTLDPQVISPDGDGIADALTISYALAARASVTVTVKDAAGLVVATRFANQPQGARRQLFSYTAAGLADGRYTVSVSAVGEDARSSRLDAPFSVDRTVSGLMLSVPVLSPNGDGADDAIAIAFTLATPANAVVQIEQAGLVLAPVFAGVLPAGTSQFSWNGVLPTGAVAPPGTYDAAVVVDGPFGQTRHAVSFTVSG